MEGELLQQARAGRFFGIGTERSEHGISRDILTSFVSLCVPGACGHNTETAIDEAARMQVRKRTQMPSRQGKALELNAVNLQHPYTQELTSTHHMWQRSLAPNSRCHMSASPECKFPDGESPFHCSTSTRYYFPFLLPVKSLAVVVGVVLQLPPSFFLTVPYSLQLTTDVRAYTSSGVLLCLFVLIPSGRQFRMQ